MWNKLKAVDNAPFSLQESAYVSAVKDEEQDPN
jgi:hypothetical protein